MVKSCNTDFPIHSSTLGCNKDLAANKIEQKYTRKSDVIVWREWQIGKRRDRQKDEEKERWTNVFANDKSYPFLFLNTASLIFSLFHISC